MDLLQVKGNRIVTKDGNPFFLRGTCIGGWMNMENFIDGYPGTESGLRDIMYKTLGVSKGEFFFERLLDYFFDVDDLKFLKKLGVTVVRLPLNYRHFEDDEHPFEYKESGFARLDKALSLCESVGIYAILDMHAVQGWQNAHWHSDNSRGISLFWRNRQFQDRFIALWEELARRYKGRTVVAGYNIMNEPCSNVADGDYPHTFYGAYVPDWDRMNRIYRRTVEAIRKIDPSHIIFLEGDMYSHSFHGLDAPFANNLVYSSHNYNAAGFGPGPYPGEFHTHRPDRQEENGYWDRNKQVEVFKAQEGTKFSERHNVPLWIGEFGSQYNGPAEEVPYRLKAMEDQINVFNQFGAHWTTWTYKDVGVMGLVTLDPESEYMEIIAPVQEKKRLLAAENFTYRYAVSPAKKLTEELATLIERTIPEIPIHHTANILCLNQAALSGYAAAVLLPYYASRFKGMSEERIDRIVSSFAWKHCQINEGLAEIFRKECAYGKN